MSCRPARLAAVTLTVAASTLSAQSAFVELRGADTIAIERFTRMPNRFIGDVVATGGPRMAYAYTVSQDGRLGEMTLDVFSPGARSDAPPMQHASVSIVGDSAFASVGAGAAQQMQRLASQPGAMPLLNSSLATFEPLIALARRNGADTASMPLFLTMGGKTFPAAFSGLRADSVTVTIAGMSSWMVTDKAGRIMRGGIPAQRLTFTRVDGIAVSKLGSRPDYRAPDNAPYTAEDLIIRTSAGHTLGGTFTKPSNATGRLPVVISITGSGAQDRDEYINIVPKGYRLFRQIADTLGRRGIAMLRMDDRGYGASEGTFATATSRDFAFDIRAGIAYLRTRPDVDPARIFVVGHSEGGMIAPMVARDEPDLAGIVLMAGPSRTGREILLFQSRYAVERDTSLTPAARAAALAKIPANVDSLVKTNPWLTFFASYDPVPTARQVKVPVLILQGGDDQQVIASEAPVLEAAFKAGGNKDVMARVFPELNHLFIHQPGGNPAGYVTLPTNLADATVIGALADWVVTHATRRTMR